MVARGSAAESSKLGTPGVRISMCLVSCGSATDIFMNCRDRDLNFWMIGSMRKRCHNFELVACQEPALDRDQNNEGLNGEGVVQSRPERGVRTWDPNTWVASPKKEVENLSSHWSSSGTPISTGTWGERSALESPSETVSNPVQTEAATVVARPTWELPSVEKNEVGSSEPNYLTELGDGVVM